MGENGVSRIALIGSAHVVGAGDGDGVVVEGAGFSQHQIVSSVDLVDMGRFGCRGFLERAVPEQIALADECHRLEVEFL